MNILITGPGAIGCLFAGLLTEAGHAVQILDKNHERASLLNKQGIIIKQHTTRTIRVPAITSATDAAEPHFICICVKSFHTESAIKLAYSAITENTYVVSLQNGIGNAEIIASHISAGKVICAVTSQGATSLDAGSIRHAGNGPTSVAPFIPESTEATREFANILTSAGIETFYRNNSLSMLWSKLIINAAINPVTALADVTNGEVLKRQDLKKLMRSAAAEGEQVANKQRIALYYKDAAAEAEKICSATALNTSSMLQDLRAGKRTEIESITGAIIKAARYAKIDVPINESLMEKMTNKLSAQALLR